MRYTALAILILILATAVIVFGFILNRPDPDSETSPTPQTLVLTITEPTITVADPTHGPSTAPVTIVEYGNYLCTACRSVAPIIAQVLAAYPQDVRFVWKDVPDNTEESQSLELAKAARCAGEQNAFWPFHQALLEQTSMVGFISPATIAQSLGLDSAAMELCLTSERARALVTRGFQEAQALELPGVPFFFLNSQPFSGSSFAEFQTAIEAILRD